MLTEREKERKREREGERERKREGIRGKEERSQDSGMPDSSPTVFNKVRRSGQR